MITKTLTAGVLAVSLAITGLTPTTATARISDEDAIVGALTLLFIGAAIHRNRSNNDAPATVRTPPPTQPRANQNWRVLPAECINRVDTRRGDTVRIFGQRCLNNNYRYVNRLPQNCHVNVRSQSGHNRQGFGARCLRNAGFRTNQR